MIELKEVKLRMRMKEYRKYKVYCAMNDLSINRMTNELIKKFMDEQSEKVRIVKIKEE